MSLAYKILNFGLIKANIKKMYDMSETELMEFINEHYRAYDVPEFLYRRFDVKKEAFCGRLLFTLSPKSEHNKKGPVVVFIHGGGGVLSPMITHYRMAGDIVKKTGATLYFPFYPLAPEHSLKESAKWLEDFYISILHRHKNFIVIGDSAGAGLAACLCAKFHKKPAGLILSSPPVGAEKRDDKMRQMEDRDLILSVKAIDLIEKYWAKGVSPDDPDINTVMADYSDFPPIHLYYGTEEIFYPHIGDLIKRIESFNIPLTVHEGKGLCHNFATIDVIREGRRAIDEMSEFILSVSKKEDE